MYSDIKELWKFPESKKETKHASDFNILLIYYILRRRDSRLDLEETLIYVSFCESQENKKNSIYNINVSITEHLFKALHHLIVFHILLLVYARDW